MGLVVSDAYGNPQTLDTATDPNGNQIEYGSDADPEYTLLISTSPIAETAITRSDGSPVQAVCKIWAIGGAIPETLYLYDEAPGTLGLGFGVCIWAGSIGTTPIELRLRLKNGLAYKLSSALDATHNLGISFI